MPEQPPKRLLDQVRDAIRRKHYAYRTEKTYVHWVKRYVLFHNKRHPEEMGKPEIEQFLTYLAVEQNVAASTQNQALSALLLLYRHVLNVPIDYVENIETFRHSFATHLLENVTTFARCRSYSVTKM